MLLRAGKIGVTGLWMVNGGNVVLDLERSRATAWWVCLVWDFAREGTAGMHTSFEAPENGRPGDAK